ncbi:MAG: hypothetical protein JNJ60_02710 [Rhodocyclaceae bacterium]|nr:hypothetical protein [Rhodocyclaceae bacterium]
MKSLFIPLFVASVGNVIYHLGQKNLDATANPMSLLMAVYAVAFGCSLALAPFFSAPATPLSWRPVLSWPVLVLGLGVLLIEVGFLLAYRTGGSLQWSGAAVNGLAALLLFPIAVALFKEGVTASKLAGIAMLVAGLYCVSRD